MAQNPNLDYADNRQLIPVWALPAMFLALAFAIYLPRTPLNALFTFPIVLAASANIFRYTSGDAPTNYSIATWAPAVVLIWLDRVVISDQSDFKYIGRRMVDPTVNNKPESNGAAVKSRQKPSLASKWLNSPVVDALSLMGVSRGIGWRWQVKGVHLPNKPLPSRWPFVLRQLLYALFYMAASDVLGSICAGTADWDSWKMTGPWNVLADVGIAWAMGFWMGFGIIGVYLTLTVVFVASGLTEPWQWPGIYGDWSECYRLRTFWASSYHQVLRRLLQSPALYLCRVLGFSKGSFLSRYTQLYVVFILSGIIHFAGSYNVTRSFNVTLYHTLDFQIMVAQAVAITLEDFVVWLWLDVLGMRRRLGAKIVPFEKAIGFVWTLACLTVSLNTYIKGLQRHGCMQTKYGGRNASWVYLKPILDRLKPT